MDLAQRVEMLASQPSVDAIWQFLDQISIDLLSTAVLIQQIPSPTFNELVRANHVLSRFGSCGLVDTGTDALYNAYGRLPGTDPSLPALLISAHSDTVFPSGTDLTVQYADNGRVCGPGLGDNSLGVAALVMLPELMQQFGIRPRRDIWFVANSREEGLGDLGGIRAFHDRQGSTLGAAIVLEGMSLGAIIHAGIAVRRLHITCHTPGGHSWSHFGRPTAVHSLIRLGARIIEITPPSSPRTTYNIGLIEGGQSINSLASEAGFYLDLRSEEADTLAVLEAQVRKLVAECQIEEQVDFQIEIVGDRPSGKIAADHELVRGAAAALRAAHLQPVLKVSSTDANLLLARGLPAISIGLTTGGNTHRLDEYIDTAPLAAGMRQLLLLVLAAAEWEPSPAASQGQQ